MNELTLTLVRLAYLVLMWFIVMSAIGVLRRDIFGSQVVRKVVSGPPGVPSDGSNGPAPAPHGGPRMMIVTKGPLKGTTITLGKAPVLLGRAPECTLVLDDDFVSNHHARLTLNGTTWVLEDLGSTNGTFLGRNKVLQATPVAPETSIRIGRTVLELRR